MLIERPPRLFRCLVPGGIFRMPVRAGERCVYLTFDDGPIPEATPWVLDALEEAGVRATFFFVGDNVRKHPELAAQVRARGHGVGTHTMHHLQGHGNTTRTYLRDVQQADSLIGSPLFRPPHGWLRPRQARALRRRYHIIMYDLVTRDYSHRVDARQVLRNLKRYARPGAIIVFHDSLRSIGKLRQILPEALRWLREQGYECRLLGDDLPKK